MALTVMKMVRAITGGDESVGDIVGRIDAERAKLAASMQEAERLETIRVSADSYEDAQAAESRLGRVRWEISRIEALLPSLSERLSVARAAAQRAGIAKHLDIARKTYPRLRAAIEAAAAVQAEAIKAREAANAELGEGVVSLHIPHISYRGFLMADLVKLWSDEQDRVFAAKPAPVAAVVAPRIAPTPARAVGVADRRVAEKPVVPGAEGGNPVKPRRTPRRDKVAPNGRLVTLMRSGVELPDGEQGVVGDIVALPIDAAERLVMSGAGDYFTSAP
jgi:hypothetical protein